jgi:predicted RNase H-like nuclease (RuvC/YqgF family)
MFPYCLSVCPCSLAFFLIHRKALKRKSRVMLLLKKISEKLKARLIFQREPLQSKLDTARKTKTELKQQISNVKTRTALQKKNIGEMEKKLARMNNSGPVLELGTSLQTIQKELDEEEKAVAELRIKISHQSNVSEQLRAFLNRVWAYKRTQEQQTEKQNR